MTTKLTKRLHKGLINTVKKLFLLFTEFILMKFLISFYFLIILSTLFAGTQPKYGQWLGKLELNSSTELPFRMVFNDHKEAPSLTILNGEEQITLMFKRRNADTLVYSFPEFDSDLHLLLKSKQSIIGYWHNKNRKGRYTIPLNAHYCEGLLFECKEGNDAEMQTLKRKWKTEFSPNSEDMFPAIGLFNQQDSLLSGTFLTETGDFRFLDGNLFGNKLYLSCFDGSHAFLFTADLNNDTLLGEFYSGIHYRTTWIANPDENYELTNPNKLTYVVNDTKLAFDFNDINLQAFHYPNESYKNKVTIIQIMGSWCPNCMDETHYFMDLYKKYHDQGLEIILVGYEAGADEQEYAAKLKRLQSRNNIPFKMLIGGAANKNKAAADFSMLNNIISFPTSIFVDKNGNISKVHTGFTGPSTGEYYTDYMQETENFIKELLKD